ncbi:hypothetical protein BDB00DRAFT_182412 [Zychaea mexicana]|uniref:uncharacterized protein n=1 Tax=Zychaea mexicana TaxID=64656 RepID=UPI0022FF430C|nr:uncharacterized protein BDB00DRAFT_182412 [Zychaea mexicana]KAI9496052.1 hypothetical protein BDB00DRAFT_182412 [Zychaea mexicana]
MCDLNWCAVCDKAIHSSLSTLYCSDECLQHDALSRHPLLGYNSPSLGVSWQSLQSVASATIVITTIAMTTVLMTNVSMAAVEA